MRPEDNQKGLSDANRSFCKTAIILGILLLVGFGILGLRVAVIRAPDAGAQPLFQAFFESIPGLIATPASTSAIPTGPELRATQDGQTPTATSPLEQAHTQTVGENETEATPMATAPPTLGDGAQPKAKSITISNVRDTSFTVAWLTEIPCDGSIEYGHGGEMDEKMEDERGVDYFGFSHSIQVLDAQPQTEYSFVIVSCGQRLNNGGKPVMIVTGPTLNPSLPDAIYGQVFLHDRTTPAEGALVTVYLKDGDGIGSPGTAALLGSLVDENGYWYANLGNARTADMTGYFEYENCCDIIHIELFVSDDRYASYDIPIRDASPVPDLYLSD